MTRRCEIIVALDTIDVEQARRWALAVRPHCGMVKLGLEFFIANGAAGVAAMADVPVFLDLKLHDIPNTVAGAIKAILPMQPHMVTLHTSGGAAMFSAARAVVDAAGDVRPLLLGVTVLTSLDDAALSDVGVVGGLRQQVLRLARLALSAGADGLVCSPLEVSMLRDALGSAPLLIVPGIRPAGVTTDDQARTMTPREAVVAGADALVIGRPITRAPNPAAAAEAIAAEIAG